MWFFLLVGLWGVFRLDVFVSFLEGFFSWGARDFFFPFFYLSFVRGGLGVLDHGAGLQVCFSFPLHYVSRLDIPDFVHFVFDGPLHCRKVEQRFQTS